MKSWNEFSRRSLGRNVIFEHQLASRENPRNGAVGDFHILMMNDWINVVAVTQAGDYLFVKQFRHGTGLETLECVAGALHKGESPESGAKRELLEELGAQAESIELLTWAYANPAIQNNKVFFLAAKGCRIFTEQKLDMFEDIEIISLKPQEVQKGLKSGLFSHQMTITALMSFDLFSRPS